MSAARDKGTRANTAIARYLQEHGFPRAERRALHGANDLGDITGIANVVIEAKDHKRIALADFLDQATSERDNAGAAIGVAWFKRRGTLDPGKWYAVMDGETLTRLLLAFAMVDAEHLDKILDAA